MSTSVCFSLKVVSPPMQKGSYPMFIVASGNCSKVMPSPVDSSNSMTFSQSQSDSTSEYLLSSLDPSRDDEMYRVQEVDGENLALGERPAEDYVVLGSLEK